MYSEEQLRDLYKKLGTGKLVAQYLGVNYKGLMRKLKQLKITNAPHKRRKIDDYYFEIIDSESKAYFLGFFFCDGYVSSDMQRFQVNLTADDGYILERFCQDSNADYTVSYKDAYAAGKTYQQSRLSINRSQFVQVLANQGVVSGKSSRNKLPVISNNLIWHFLRGMYDADGFILVNHAERIHPVYELGFTAYPDIIQELDQVLSGHGFNDLHMYKCGTSKVYTLSSAKRDTVYRLGTELYNNATVYLSRKKDKFDTFVETYYSPSVL